MNRSRQHQLFAILAGLLLTAAIFALYSPSLNFQFILDDHRFTADPRIQFPGHLWDYFSNYVWAQYTGGPPSFYRPLFVLWMRLNYLLSAESPWGWHFLSIAKHAAVCIILGLLVLKLLRDRIAALLAATLFALHPAHTESVSWTTVPDPLMSIAVLASLLLYLKFVDVSRPVQPINKSRKSLKKKDTAPSVLWLVASAAVCFAALLAKETAIILPILIFAIAFAVPDAPTQNPTLKSRVTHALSHSWLFFFATAVFLLLRFNALDGKLAAATQRLPFTAVLLSAPATLWFYITAIFWPAHSYSFADSRVIQTLSPQAVLLPAAETLLVAIVIAASIIWAWKKSANQSSPESPQIHRSLTISLLLLILPLLLTLNLNALNPGDFLHGRYTYLPLAGLTLLLATLIHVAALNRIPVVSVSAAIAIAFSVLTVKQESQWKDDLTVFTAAHQLAPSNIPVARHLADAHVQTGLQLDQQGRCSEAIPIFEQVTAEFPDDWYAWASLGDCYVQLSQIPQAEQSFHRAADLSKNPRTIEQWRQLRTQLGLPTPSN